MGLQLDHSRDAECWDNTEAGVYTSVRIARGGGDMSDMLEGVIRRALNRRELAAGNGIYTGDDRVFVVPRRALQGFLEQERPPKPRDRYQDEDGDTYTVLEAAHNARDKSGPQVYRLTCRNLVLAYDLRDVVDIEEPQIVYSDAGAKLKRWPPTGGEITYRRLPARVQEVSQEITDEFGMNAFKGNYTITVDRQIDISDEARVKWVSGGVTRYFDLKAVRNTDKIDELPVLEVELTP